MRHVWRLQILGTIPALVVAQSAVPATASELASADRAAWVAALAAACDSIPVDSTWREYRLPDSEGTFRLPSALSERGEILRGAWYNALPALPERDYALEHLDPLTTRLFLAQATSVFRCPGPNVSGTRPALTVLVVGFDDRPQEKEAVAGIWNVIATWDDRQPSLWAMSRDSGVRRHS